MTYSNTAPRQRCDFCHKVIYHGEMDAVVETHRVYNLRGEYRRAYYEPKCGNWHVTSQPYAPRDAAAEQQREAVELFKLIAKVIAGLAIWTVAMFAVPAYFMIMPVAGGLLSVCISSLLLGETPTMPPGITFYLFGALLLCVAGRLIMVAVICGRWSLPIYALYFLIVTLIGFAGSASGLIPPLSSWAADVGDGSVAKTLHLMDPFFNVEWAARDIGINAEGSLDAAGNWFEGFRKEAIGSFAFTFWAILIVEICLAIAWLVKYNVNKRNKEQANRQAAEASAD